MMKNRQSILRIASSAVVVASMFVCSASLADDRNSTDRIPRFPNNELAGKTFLRQLNNERPQTKRKAPNTDAASKLAAPKPSTPKRFKPRGTFTVLQKPRRLPKAATRPAPPNTIADVPDSSSPKRHQPKEASNLTRAPRAARAMPNRFTVARVRAAQATTADLKLPSPYPPDTPELFVELKPEPDPLFTTNHALHEIANSKPRPVLRAPRRGQSVHKPAIDITNSTPPLKLPTFDVATSVAPASIKPGAVNSKAPEKLRAASWSATKKSSRDQFRRVPAQLVAHAPRLRPVPQSALSANAWRLPVAGDAQPASSSVVSAVPPRLIHQQSVTRDTDAEIDKLFKSLNEVDDVKTTKPVSIPIDVAPPESEAPIKAHDTPVENPFDAEQTKSGTDAAETSVETESMDDEFENDRFGLPANEPSEEPATGESTTQDDVDSANDTNSTADKDQADEDEADKDKDDRDETDEDDQESDTENTNSLKAADRLFVPVESIDVAQAMRIPVDKDSKFTEPKNRAREMPGARTARRSWVSTAAIRAHKPQLLHQPLYFNENDLEVCGVSAGKATNLRSTVRFFGSVVAMPLQACATGPWQLVSGELRCTSDPRPVVRQQPAQPMRTGSGY